MGGKGRGRGQAGQKGGETIADPPSSFRIRWGSSPPPTLLYCPGSSFSAKAPQAKRGTFFLEEVKKGYEAAAPPALQLREGGRKRSPSCHSLPPICTPASSLPSKQRFPIHSTSPENGRGVPIHSTFARPSSTLPGAAALLFLLFLQHQISSGIRSSRLKLYFLPAHPSNFLLSSLRIPCLLHFSSSLPPAETFSCNIAEKVQSKSRDRQKVGVLPRRHHPAPKSWSFLAIAALSI